MGRPIINKIGETNINSKGLKMTIIRYNNAKDMDIQFEDGFIRHNVAYKEFSKGWIRHPKDIPPPTDKRIGEIRKQCYDSTAKIIKYINSKNIYVEILESKEIIKTQYKTFQKGGIKPRFVPHIFGKGYIGNGYTKVKSGTNIDKISYIVWTGILERCYSEKERYKYPTYEKCEICDEWCNFEVFEKWFTENYYEIGEERMHLDKDILVKGNKIYSPETCVFVPQKINVLFVKSNSKRGAYPIGVYYDKKNEKFKSQCNIFGVRTYLGLFNTPEEAFNTYKEKKESIIKEVADQYKDKIPEKLYNAMYNYKVEITD